MDVKITNQDNKTLVTLEGRLDTTNADQFQKDIEPLMQGDKPETDDDRAAIEKLARFSFPPDRTFEFDVDLRSPPAPGLRAVFSYSKGTRSILRGSFLEPVAGAFMDIAP